MCPDCNTYGYTKTTGAQSYPYPKELLGMTEQYRRRQLQEQLLDTAQKVRYPQEVTNIPPGARTV